MTSPSEPINRTSFALISSFSRFSFSFALIAQHLQNKKNNRTKIPSPYDHPNLGTLLPKRNESQGAINQHHNRCAGENGAFYFVLLEYYTTLSELCQVFFRKKLFIIFFFYQERNRRSIHCLSDSITTKRASEPTTSMSIVKHHKKHCQNDVKFCSVPFSQKFTSIFVTFEYLQIRLSDV